MIDQGAGRVRFRRFLAVTIPAALLAAVLGIAIVQGAVAASIASSTPFQIAGSSATGSGLEVSLRGAKAATSNSDTAPQDKETTFVTLKDGTITDLCLAADQAAVPFIGTIGLKIRARGKVNLGERLDISAQSLRADSAELTRTRLGVSQSQLTQQNTVADGYNPGGFGIQSTHGVTFDGLDVSAYGLTLNDGLVLQNLSIMPTRGSVTGTC